MRPGTEAPRALLHLTLIQSETRDTISTQKSALNGGEYQAVARKPTTKPKPAHKCKECGEVGHDKRTCSSRIFGLAHSSCGTP